MFAKRYFAFLLSFSLLSPLVMAEEVSDQFKQAVVKLIVTQRAPDFARPWSKGNPTETFGTGFVISGNRIITNAHVVQYASQMYVQLHQSDEKLEARAELVAHDLDLAIVRLDDPSQLEQVKPLEIDETLTPLRAEVSVYGFPVGGDQLSITKGIVSRIEHTQISLGRTGLRVQVDAAINPGNSGGPVLWNGKVIGVAYSIIASANSIGYLIHASELLGFLRDVEDARYDGAPLLWDYYQTVENSGLRTKLQLPKGLGGVLVNQVNSAFDQDYPLRVNDIITHIGPHPIDSQGKVRVQELLLHFQYHCASQCVDGKIPLTIWREGEERKVDCPAPRQLPGVLPLLKGTYPRYFILGPLTFCTASTELVMGLTNSPKMQTALSLRRSPLLTSLSARTLTGEAELVVIPNSPFSHRLMKGYGPPILNSVKAVNGIEVRNLSHLVEIFRDCRDEYFEFEFYDQGAERLILPRKEMLDSTSTILEDNNIREQFSPDLAKVWKGA
jgi:S1-C subfamily serine protease